MSEPEPEAKPRELTRVEIVYALARWLERNDLEKVPLDIHIDTTFFDRKTTVLMFVSESNIESKDVRRALKRAFGPFVPEGEPPTVILKGGSEIHGIGYVKCCWMGAYKCKIIDQQEVEQSEEDKQRNLKNSQHYAELAAKTTITKNIYDCVPVSEANEGQA